MNTTRDRKLAFIGDKYALYRAVDTILMRKGADWLTDEQIDDLVRMVIFDDRRRNRENRRNREHTRKVLGLPPRPGLARGTPTVIRDGDVRHSSNRFDVLNDDDGPEAA